MNWDNLQVIVRAVLQGVAGILVSKGVVDASGAEGLVGGLISIASVVWSLFHKSQIKAGQ